MSPCRRAAYHRAVQLSSAPSESVAIAATASSIDCSRASDADRTCEYGEADQCPNERKPIFFMGEEERLALDLATAGAEEPDRTELAKLCSRVENDWVGAETGLLDGVELIGKGTITDRIWTKPSISVLGIDAPRTQKEPRSSVRRSGTAIVRRPDRN